MSTPDKCPRWSGGGLTTFPTECPLCEAGPGPFVNSYLCGTYLRAGVDYARHQTKRCLLRQRDQLSKKLECFNRANSTAKDMLCAELGISNDGSVGIIDAISSIKEANANIAARLSVAERERDRLLAHIEKLEAAGDELRKASRVFFLPHVDDEFDDGTSIDQVDPGASVQWEDPPTAGDHVRLRDAMNGWIKAKGKS